MKRNHGEKKCKNDQIFGFSLGLYFSIVKIYSS